MILNDEELAIELEALGCVERALDSLRQKLMPQNPKNFAIYSEGYVDQIEIIKAQIEEYLQRRKSLPPESKSPQTTTGQQPSSVS